MNTTEEIQRQIKINKLTIEERYCLDGYLVTGNKQLAYRLSRPKESTASRTSFNTQVYKYFQREEVLTYLELRREDIKNGTFFNQTKDKDVKEISETINQNYDSYQIQQSLIDGTYTKGSEVPLEYLQDESFRLYNKITDVNLKAKYLLILHNLRGFDKSGDDTAKKSIKYFIPLKCYQCPLYTKEKSKQEIRVKSE